ncbi:PREDICTED: putative uncharacterized protein DDB_G0286901 [Polistes dominula]|uniref:Uncharacterized protein n=1 Tax=Polistes dominula TaxID=743375 RepID=A0ABM1IJ89_POLDO|nr:PREDICTED: putative uncharacterized protein DDB_G0286901 [Polistes dominula]
MNYAKDFVKPSKSSFQERKKIIQPNTRSSTIVFSNNYLTSNLNPHTLSFFQQNNRIFTNNNIEGSSLDQNDLTLNHVTPFNDRKTLLQPKEEFIQSYPYSQVISMLQSYSNLNDNSNQNDSTNLNQHDQKSNPCCFICLPNVSNYNCLKQEESQENLNINNLQDVQQNQLIIDTYNPQNTIYKDVTKYNNVTNNVPSSSSSYSIGSNYYFEQEYNDNRINLVNQSKCCYVKKQLACDFCDCDQNDNVFNILKYSKGGRPILKRKL